METPTSDVQELGYMFVLCVPSGYPNPTKEKITHFYPISTPVPAVDVYVFFFSSGARVSPERGSGASESNQNVGGGISHV